MACQSGPKTLCLMVYGLQTFFSQVSIPLSPSPLSSSPFLVSSRKSRVFILDCWVLVAIEML